MLAGWVWTRRDVVRVDVLSPCGPHAPLAAPGPHLDRVPASPAPSRYGCSFISGPGWFSSSWVNFQWASDLSSSLQPPAPPPLPGLPPVQCPQSRAWGPPNVCAPLGGSTGHPGGMVRGQDANLPSWGPHAPTFLHTRTDRKCSNSSYSNNALQRRFHWVGGGREGGDICTPMANSS